MHRGFRPTRSMLPMKSGGELSILQYSFDTGNKKPVHLSIKCQGISDRIMIQHLAASNCPIQFHVANLRHGRLLYTIHTSNRMIFCHNLLVPESIRASRANWKRTGKEPPWAPDRLRRNPYWCCRCTGKPDNDCIGPPMQYTGSCYLPATTEYQSGHRTDSINKNHKKCRGNWPVTTYGKIEMIWPGRKLFFILV